MTLDIEQVRAAVRAGRRASPAKQGLLELLDLDGLDPILDPVIEADGVDAVVGALAPYRHDPDLVEALFYVLWENDRNMLSVFTEEEVIDAALACLVLFGEDRSGDTVGYPHWGWSALWQHDYGGDDHLTDEQAFRLLLAVIDRVPMDDSILWMIGDGPLSHARGHREYRRRVEALAEAEPKIARAIRLDEVDYPYGTP